jgi:hypothetical protein
MKNTWHLSCLPWNRIAGPLGMHKAFLAALLARLLELVLTPMQALRKCGFGIAVFDSTAGACFVLLLTPP